ncbi:MAG: DUF5717 family protein [Eubacteriales bacterium]|nr:DUF5717 family protein [Eubacteriales bacterium]
MKDNIDFMNEKINNSKTPIVHLSTLGLDLSVEEGEIHRGSLTLESENGLPFRGKVYSTSDKMQLDVESFEGQHHEFHYTFDGSMAIEGENYSGDFVFITNGGEFNLPYMVSIEAKTIRTANGSIRSMVDFQKLYQQSKAQAMEIFFHPNFSEVMLKDEPEKRMLYHGLMKSRNKNLIMEEFLTAAGYKEVTILDLEEKGIVLDSGKNEAEIVISMNTDGYVEGKITCQKNQVGISHEKFTSNDFVDGKLVVRISKNQNYTMGSDVICIDNVRQHFEIPVEWWGTLPEVTDAKEQALQIKRYRAELMHNYLYFRTGGIRFEDFADSSRQILDQLVYRNKEVIWKLFLMHISLMEQKQEEAEEILTSLEERKKNETFSTLEEHYFLYLKSMFYGTPEAISEAVIAIRSFYENSEYKDLALWMLIYIDRDYVSNKKLQYDTIKMLFEQGCNNSLLYYEACSLLNENPTFMDETGPFEISIFRWGVRYGVISLSLAYQFARLALKAKYYQKSVFHIAQKLYQIKQDERFLQVICSLLIKGNRIGKEYHEYFRAAVEANLKIIGLNEFFIRSADFSLYEKLPQRVLIYFTYSNTLDSTEKAYLYTNILKNKESYEEVFGAYYSKMIPFVEEQLLKGRMNEQLAYLYSYFQKEILEKKENAKAVCDILFYQKIRCGNPRMIGVYVACPELGTERYYPLSGGNAYVEYYNERSQIYFVDSSEQRYVKDIECYFTPFLTLKQFPDEWVRRNQGNKKVLLMLSARIDERMAEDEVKIAQKVVNANEYKPWIRVYALEQLLTYYSNHQKKDDLDQWLDRVNYEEIDRKFRKRLIDYYMEVGRLESAFYGVEKYGVHIMGAAKRLKLANFGIEFFGWRKQPTVLALARSAFNQKKYNKDSLSYLISYMEGEMEELYTLWERSRKFEVKTTDLERKILSQCIFTDNDTERVFPVFSSLLNEYLQMKEMDDEFEDKETEKVIGQYLEFASLKELHGSMKLTEEMHMAIGNEILKGRIDERHTKIHFLYYFAGKPLWRDLIKEAAAYIIEGFLKERFYLPVYHSYEDIVFLPIAYREFTFLTYHGGINQDVRIYYEIEGQKDYWREKKLDEVMPGMYVCHMHFYHNDHVNYRLEESGEKVQDSNQIQFETFRYDNDDSRFFTLNHMTWEENGMEKMKSYLMQSYFTDHFMKLL